MRRVPAAELGVEAGGAAGDDRHLLAADRSFLHLAVRSLRHRAPQHRVSVSTAVSDTQSVRSAMAACLRSLYIVDFI